MCTYETNPVLISNELKNDVQSPLQQLHCKTCHYVFCACPNIIPFKA